MRKRNLKRRRIASIVRLFDNMYPKGYNILYEIKTTVVFDKWLKKLKDRSAKIRILARIDRVSHGNFGDIKEIDNPLTEMRFFFGSGYRIYYVIRENTIVLLLNGGDKDSQKKDIEKAKEILKALGE